MTLPRTQLENKITGLKKAIKVSTRPDARLRFIDSLNEAKRELKRLDHADAVKVQIRSCRACGLNRTRKRPVAPLGPIYNRADLVIVTDSPTSYEDQTGEPFTGPAGKLLSQLVLGAGSDMEKMFLMSSVCCRPAAGDSVKAGERAACSPNLRSQLKLAGVPVGLILGPDAYSAVMEVPRSNVKMAEIDNAVAWKDSMVWVSTYSLAYILRHKGERAEVGRALQMALALRFGRSQPPIPPWQQIEIDGHRVNGLDDAMKSKGWALVHSKTLDSQILVVDEGFKKGAGPRRIPGKVQHLPRYELSELIAMGMVSKGRGTWGRDDLRKIHMVKHEFGGKVFLEQGVRT